MPKLAQSKPLDIPPNLVCNLNYFRQRKGLSVPDLAQSMRISYVTLYDRLKHPQDFTLEELALAARTLGVTSEILQRGTVQIGTAV